MDFLLRLKLIIGLYRHMIAKRALPRLMKSAHLLSKEFSRPNPLYKKPYLLRCFGQATPYIMKYDTVINVFNFNRCIDSTFDFNLLYAAIGHRSLTVNGLERINYIQSIVPAKPSSVANF